MEAREKDVQELCNQVLQMSTIFWDNPNGPYEDTCPLCGESIQYGGNFKGDTSMSGITHSSNCGYLIAKDLTSGIES